LEATVANENSSESFFEHCHFLSCFVVGKKLSSKWHYKIESQKALISMLEDCSQ
jgi:hypothetical protein